MNVPGLYHTAILYPTRKDLAVILKRLMDANYPLTGASDHGVSEAIYLNPDFAVGFVMKVSNAIQERVSGYFLGEEIVTYFEVKKCSESCCCAAVGSRNRISTAKSGFNDGNGEAGCGGAVEIAGVIFWRREKRNGVCAACIFSARTLRS